MIQDLVALCVSLSERAGDAIRMISNQEDLMIGDIKLGQFDPQTEADRLSQAIINDILKLHYPKCTIIGEEGDNIDGIELSKKYKEFFNPNLLPSNKVLQKCTNIPQKLSILTDEDFIIWLDPLDGTSDFASGLRDHVTVLIGIASKNGEPIAGIVHQPFYTGSSCYGYESNLSTNGRTIWGIVGIGAFNLNNLSSNKYNGFVVATSKTHVDEIVLHTMSYLGVDKVLHTPGAGFKAIQLMEKYVDAFIYPGKGTCKWDICATDAICRSLDPSLVVTDFFGNPFNYSADTEVKNKHGLIAASHVYHKLIMDNIPQETLDYLK